MLERVVGWCMQEAVSHLADGGRKAGRSSQPHVWCELAVASEDALHALTRRVVAPKGKDALVFGRGCKKE